MPAQLAALPVPVAPRSNDLLEARILQLAAQIPAATYRLLVLIAEFDARKGWAGWGINYSCMTLAPKLTNGSRPGPTPAVTQQILFLFQPATPSKPSIAPNSGSAAGSGTMPSPPTLPTGEPKAPITTPDEFSL